MTNLVLPNVPAEVLNGLATRAAPRQATVAAAGSRVRVVYGRQMIGADVFFVGTLGNDLILGCGWCLGEIDAIEQVYINGAVPASSVTQTHYLGTATQGVDATIAAAKAGYADTQVATFVGKTVAGAYSVLRIPGAASSGYPRVEAIVRGRKVYDPRENLLRYSEQFDVAPWSASSVTVTPNATVAPDGNITADEITDSTTTAVGRSLQSASIPQDNLTYTVSVYLKQSTSPLVTVWIELTGGTYQAATAWFNIATGSIVSPSIASARAESVGNGWYRVSISVQNTAANTLASISVHPAPGTVAGTYDNAVTGSVYAWGAQINTGAIALGYVSTAASRVVPIWQNLLTYSEQFDNAAWTLAGGGSITANAAQAPDGNTTAELLSGAYGYVSRPFAFSVGQQYTLAVWVKTVTAGNTFQLGALKAGDVATSYVVVTPTTSWQRYTFTFSPTVDDIRVFFQNLTGATGVYIWGAQLNKGATAYGYTMTTSAAVDGVYSTSPALILRDFITSPIYGQGLAVDSLSVTNVASACDQLLGDGSKRRELNILIDKPAPAAQWADALAEYAGCFIVRDGSTVKLVPNRPAAVAAALTESDIMAGSLRLRKRSSRRAPTVVRVNYTDTTSVPWQDKPAYAHAAGVLDGTTPWREEPVDMPGITSYAQAARVALERLNAATLTDMDAEFVCFDKGLAYQEGDVVSITYAHYGLSAKAMRVRTIEHERPGRWRVTANEYNAAVYSDDVTAGTGLDSGLPSPDSIDPPTGVTVASGSAHLLLLADGTIISRMLVTWTAPADLYYDHAEVEYQRNGDTEWTRAPSLTASAYCSPVEDGTSYAVRVRAVNSFGIASTWATTAHVVVGKTEAPPPPQSFLITTDPDGTRRFTWQPPVTPPLDLYGYQIRYKLGTGHTWASMTPLHEGVLLSSPYETNQLAAGTYTLAIASVDTTGNVSSAVYIEGTLPDPRLAGVLEIVEPHTLGWPGTKTNCWVDPNTGQLLATDSKQWSSFPTDAVTWANWTQWARASNTMTYTHSTIDVGIVTKFTPLVSVNGVGTQTIEIRTSSDGSTWSSWAAPAGPVTARYLDARVTMTGSGARLDTMTIILDAAPVTEDINDLATSSLTGSYRIGAGDIRIPITKTYGLIRIVTVMLQNVGPGWSVEVIDKTTAVGPRIKIYNASNVLADATIDVNVRGV